MPVERRDIVVSAQAAGAIQPDTTVEVKSKASGEILQLNAETGQTVKRGALLVRIDPRNARNALAQAQADLDVAQAQLANATSQKRRADELFTSQSITEQEHEQALLDFANAKAAVVRATGVGGQRQDPAGGHRRARADDGHDHREGRRAGNGDRLGHVQRERRHDAAQDGQPRSWCRCGRWWTRPTWARSSRGSAPR